MITVVFYFNIDPNKHLEDRGTEAGRYWEESLDKIETAEGFRRLYWGRRLEEPEKVQLHIVWSAPGDDQTFRASPLYHHEVLRLWTQLTGSSLHMNIRHTTLQHQVLDNPFGQSLLGYPIGTAIYKSTNAAWHEGAWPLWTHVVRHVEGCKGIAAGSVEEAVEGLVNSYLVYVAWETVKHHDDYHHTEHFRKHWVILQIGHQGYTEYGHVIFKEIREGKGSSNKL